MTLLPLLFPCDMSGGYKSTKIRVQKKGRSSISRRFAIWGTISIQQTLTFFFGNAAVFASFNPSLEFPRCPKQLSIQVQRIEDPVKWLMIVKCSPIRGTYCSVGPVVNCS
jgi:hypothetical protein